MSCHINIFLIFVLYITSFNAKSENIHLKYSPAWSCILPSVNSVATGDIPSPAGLVFKMKKINLTPDQIKEIIYDYRENLFSQYDIWKKYKIRRNRIKTIFIENNVEMRTLSEASMRRRIKCTLSHEQEMDIISKYNNKISCAEISTQYKKHPSVIRGILLKYNVAIRGIRERNMRYSMNENYFDCIGKEQSWMLGLFAADGCVRNDCYISITQSKARGLKLIKYIKRLLCYDGKIYTRYTELNDKKFIHHILGFSSLKVVSIFKEYNIVCNKTLIYKLPDKTIDFKNFLRGYFDGDGSVGIYSNGNRKYSTKYLQASFVGTKAFTLQCVSKIPILCNISKNKAKNLYQLTWNGKKAIEFLEWLWSDSNLWTWYKHDIFHDFQKNYNPSYKTNEIKRNNVIEMAKNGARYIDIKRRYKYSADFIIKNMKKV